MKKYFLFVLLGALFVLFFPRPEKVKNPGSALRQVLCAEKFEPLDDDRRLYVIAGIDYIPYELIELFESLTGVKVILDIFDSNEILEAKLLAGGAKYDVVFPTAWPHFSRQLKAKIYRKLDKTRLDLSIFDEDILKRLAVYDQDNSHALPYQFGISGIGLDEKNLGESLKDAPRDSLALLFDPVYAKKISKYRISLYESPNELFPAVLAYLGLNPETEERADIIKAADHLKKIRCWISKFTSFGFEDLSSGNACVTLATSGDVLRVGSDNNKPSIKFFYPREGAALWVDVVAIPLGAKHINNIYAFLKFLFHPMVMAHITNCTSRANAVMEASKYVEKRLMDNQNIYPTIAIRKKCYIEKPLPPHIEVLRTRLLTKIKSMDR
ncbi:MAG: ABC transporter substrate-binding protein [Holosporaceae bacterium]|jgi:putrescine transport system substrate-binding protein|nr:ABC transporter substrate-binding protein [Holosporaceae bacterium]